MISVLVSMEGHRGGSSTPSHSHVVSNHFKEPMEGETGSINIEKHKNIRSQEQEENHEEVRRQKGIGGGRQRAKQKNMTGFCKPRSTITPQFVLSNSVLQVHMDHMAAYVVICKFMGIWPTEKALHAWIKKHWKPKGEINLHLGSKGFFTIVFTDLEDKDRVFEGGPYFYATTGLYMRPWVMNFVLE